MFKLSDTISRRFQHPLARAQAFFAAKRPELDRHNQQMLRWMLPLYFGVLIFWRAVLGGVPICAVILNAALLAHGVLTAMLFVCMRGQRPLKPRFLDFAVLLFGLEILITAALLDTLGAPESTAMLYPLALVLMSQVYSLPPKNVVVVLLGGMGGYLLLAALYKTPQAFSRDVLAMVGALMLGMLSYITLTYHKVIAYEEQKRLHYLCVHDPLTGVFNVSAFEQAYQTRFVDTPHLFGILDMDNFKEINDSAGHNMGDSVLMVFSAAISEQLAAHFPASLVGRFGGDEFLIAASGYGDLEDVTDRLEEMQQAVCSRMQKSFSRPISFSMGIVLSCKSDSFREVFGSADREMYRAKEGSSRSPRGQHAFEIVEAAPAPEAQRERPASL